METTILILCAGKQHRWENDTLKQFMPVGKELIIQRIVRQVRERGHNPTIVTHKENYLVFDTPLVNPPDRRWKISSLLTTQRLWESKNTKVLLGDVIYSKNSMDRIIADQSDVMFFGNYAEIFAVNWTQYMKKTAIEKLEECIKWCENHGDKGTLHSLFRCWGGYKREGSIEKEKDTSPIWTFLTCDYTRDIDCYQDWQRLQSEVVESNKLDDT